MDNSKIISLAFAGLLILGSLLVNVPTVSASAAAAYANCWNSANYGASCSGVGYVSAPLACGGTPFSSYCAAHPSSCWERSLDAQVTCPITINSATPPADAIFQRVDVSVNTAGNSPDNTNVINLAIDGHQLNNITNSNI